MCGRISLDILIKKYSPKGFAVIRMLESARNTVQTSTRKLYRRLQVSHTTISMEITRNSLKLLKRLNCPKRMNPLNKGYRDVVDC